MTNHETDRRERYAAALLGPDAAGTLDAAADEMLDAVIAVADAEQAAMPAAVSVPPPAPRADDQAALRDRIAEALRPGSRDRSGQYPEGLMRDVDAVLAVLPEPTDRAAVLRDAADCAETVAVRLNRDGHVERSNGAYDVMDVLHRAAAVSGLCVAGEQQNETPETEPGCAHCGKTIRRITGTLAEWWVHEPGGHTVCFPEQAASSPRATPKPAAGAPTATKPETDEPASTCTCGAAGDAFVPLGHYRDCPDAAGVRQDGAQQ